MKHYLISHSGQFYKANLHSHSIYSDGEWTPQKMKEEYQKHGYSIIAFTDHDVLIPHHELDDENFLALTGIEYHINSDDDVPGAELKTCHFCAIAKEKTNDIQPIWGGRRDLWAGALTYMDMVKYDASKPLYIRNYSVECINEMMDICQKSGFYVTYNHPTWSEENFETYTKYRHFDAIEILNTGSNNGGYDEYNSRVYDDILQNVANVSCIMADDNHNREDENSVQFDSYEGFTMIKAPRLEYREITKALENGDFYCSQAPQIYDLWIEDNKVCIDTSPVRSISIQKGIRSNRIYGFRDHLVTHAEFLIEPNARYFRLSLRDEYGMHANTNAYFVEDLVKKGILRY